MTNPLADLEKTVEEIRATRFSALPASLVAAVIKVEAECIGNRSEAARRVKDAIEAFLDSKGA